MIIIKEWILTYKCLLVHTYVPLYLIERSTILLCLRRTCETLPLDMYTQYVIYYVKFWIFKG